MDFSIMSDKAILKELGSRVRRQRLNRNITQAELAENAGVGRTVVQKVEQGEECMLSGLIRIMRALSLLDQLDTFLPEPGLSPIQLARLQGRERQRASGERNSEKKQEA